jgi:tRNA-uridine 2-sulfurtransferase
MKQKAFVLYSGGLDSILAVKLMQDQKIPVVAVHFITPFFDRSDFCRKVAKKQGFKLVVLDLGKDYIKMLRKPKHGYGSALNPCIDCHSFMLKTLKKMAKGGFIVTGEVVGQRPMSQKKNDLDLIEKEVHLKGKILRPLSAKILSETAVEKKGIVDRSKFFGISGRSRDIQFKLAKKYDVEHLTPAGGCLLAEKEYSNKLKDLLAHKKTPTKLDFKLLKKGRHFRLGENKIVVGRREEENYELEKLKGKSDYVFKADGIGPITLLLGKKTKEAIELAAKITLRYSDEVDKEVLYGKKFEKRINVEKPSPEEIEKFRII